ncbi:MAG: trimethylamine methyltransferase family protein [Planctomycetes bacterium]|nr:trimethylamine methyltransferase family protein [Planctomycetota bacterium]
MSRRRRTRAGLSLDEKETVMEYRPQLSRPYSDADMESILTDGLRILKQIGVACSEPQTVERVTAEPGVTWEGGRLKFEPDAMREHVAAIRRRLAPKASAPPPPFELLAAWSGLNYADPETGEVRPPTTEDAVLMTRLMDAFGGHDWSIPLVPSDVNPRYATLTSEYIALSNSRALGGFMSVMDPTEIEFLIEMHQAVGRTYLLDEQIGISPLRFNDHGLASALKFMGRDDVRVILVGSIPAVGSTVPFNLRAAVATVVAERLSLSMTCERLGTSGGGYGGGFLPFDFQYLTIGFGSAEEGLFAAMDRQLGEYINGVPNYFGAMHSIARMPDAQAAAEKTANALFQALIGRRRFRGGGQLAVDEVFSPQQLIIDQAILQHVERIVHGFDPLAQTDDLMAEVQAGIAEGNYVGEESTVRGYRQNCLMPDLFHHYNVGHWRQLGSPTILAEAWDRCKGLIAACDFHLPDDQARALESTYRKALRTLV